MPKSNNWFCEQVVNDVQKSSSILKLLSLQCTSLLQQINTRDNYCLCLNFEAAYLLFISAKWTEWTGEISCFTLFSVVPSVHPSVRTQNLWAKLTQLEVWTRDLCVARQANVMTTTLRWIRDNGVYKSLNAQQQANRNKITIFILKDNKRNVKNNTVN